MKRPWDTWRCPVCGKLMTLQDAAEGFCRQIRRSKLCPLPLDLRVIEEQAS